MEEAKNLFQQAANELRGSRIVGVAHFSPENSSRRRWTDSFENTLVRIIARSVQRIASVAVLAQMCGMMLCVRSPWRL
jgi:hypothetical protein